MNDVELRLGGQLLAAVQANVLSKAQAWFLADWMLLELPPTPLVRELLLRLELWELPAASRLVH